MDLTIFALKQLWKSDIDKNYYTNGGFPLQVAAISELFDNTNIICPVSSVNNTTNSLTRVKGKKVKVLELLTPISGNGFMRKIYFIPWFFKNLKILIAKVRQADAVHAVVMGDLGVIAMILSLIMKKKLIVRYCGNWYKNDSFSEKIVKIIMKLTAGGKNIMLATGAGGNPPSRKNSNVKWIFSTSLSENQIKNNNTFKSIKSNDKYKILVVSRQTTDKGTQKVIQALNILRKEFDIELTVVGDGPDLTYFKQLANRLHLEDKIKFVGQVKQIDVYEYLKTADFYCFPSVSSEGFPKSVIEAISFGIPVLCSSVSALPYLFKNGGGIILDEPHVDDIVKKIRHLIKNKKQYEEISIEANNISKKYSLENWKNTIKLHINEQWTVSN